MNKLKDEYPIIPYIEVVNLQRMYVSVRIRTETVIAYACVFSSWAYNSSYTKNLKNTGGSMIWLNPNKMFLTLISQIGLT